MTRAGFDVERCRGDFPMLATELHGRPLAYLDNAATTHKPRAVLDALQRFYAEGYASVHRGVHTLGERATAAYEEARAAVQRFVGARAPGEIVFVRGATEAVNLVAQSWGARLRAGDEVLITEMEHHSDIVPWQMVCAQRGAALRVAPVDERGELEVGAYERLLGPRTRMVALAHASNALGTVNPVAELVERAHRAGALVLVDGAQAAPHLPIDVTALGCDFYALSAHKMYGPTGIGALYGRAELLADMPPYQGGGEMIHSVSFEHTTYAPPPQRFEAGTPHIAGAIGLGAAVEYLAGLDRAGAAAHEQALLARASEALVAVPGVRLVGRARDKVSLVSFILDGVHPHDLGTVLDRAGIAIRTGHLCAQPLLRRLGLPAVARASLSFYNTAAEVDRLAAAVARAREVLG